MDLDITDYERGVLTGLVVSAANEAGRDGRTGPWVDGVLAILAAINRDTNQAAWKVPPVGDEPFGTKVTLWSAHWGARHAVITSSPRPQAERKLLDTSEWDIVIKGDGMISAPAEALTLGWHPEGER